MSTDNQQQVQAGAENLSIFSIGDNKDKMDAGMFREKFDNPLFDPRVKQAGDQLVFIIRPMPYVHNPLKSMISKSYYAFRDNIGVIMFDSRTTFNRPAENHWEFCPPSDVWLKLRKSPDPDVKKIAGWIRQQRANYCYVQVVNYPADTSFNGKILPMRIPVEMVKLFDSMSNPTEQDLALGTKPVQPFNIMDGMNIKCTVLGHKQDDILMRKWTCKTDGPIGEASFPLGKDGAMVPVSKLKQEDVLKHFEEQQTIDLEEQYGYKEPSIDTKRRMKALLQAWTNHIPGMPAVTATYFPELREANAVDQNAQHNAPTVFNPGDIKNDIAGGDPMGNANTQPTPPAKTTGTPGTTQSVENAQATNQAAPGQPNAGNINIP